MICDAKHALLKKYIKGTKIEDPKEYIKVRSFLNKLYFKTMIDFVFLKDI